MVVLRKDTRFVGTPPPNFQNVSFDRSVEKCHCQINVVGRYVLISKMNRKLFSCVCIA